LSAYVLVEIDIRDPVRYEEYKRLAPSSIRTFGGRYLVRGGDAETLEGSWQAARLVILEFPDRERARAWWSSLEYSAAKALRQACAETRMVLVEGAPPVVA
jgi:uncharacterized protein (DUF1330 family)